MTEEFAFMAYGSHDHAEGMVVELGPFRIEARQVVHPVAAYALKVTAGGRTLVYSGDTGPCPQLDEVATGAHLLLAEASFRSIDDNPPDLHMTGTDCGRTASRAGVERLVLTHVPPWHDPADAEAEARAEWSGPVDLARAGATYDV
jgi:ribonuclease BN (tRNA processing enzyme)